MPRLAFEEPKGGPAKRTPTKHRRETKRDTVVVVLKAATFGIVAAVVGAVVLLATAGGEQDAKAPAVPEIETSHARPTTTTSTPLAAIVAPEVRSQTAEIVPSIPPTTTTTRPSEPTAGRSPGRPADRFAVVGQPCETRGAYAFTESYEPVVCGGPRRGQELVWRRLFR